MIYGHAALRSLARCRASALERHPYTMRITFPGTGPTHGVHKIDCVLGDTDRRPAWTGQGAATEPRCQRARASKRVEHTVANLMINTSRYPKGQYLPQWIRFACDRRVVDSSDGGRRA